MTVSDSLQQLGISRDAVRERGLREYEEANASALELVETDAAGKAYQLTVEAAAAWRAMKAAAAEAGIVIFLESAFRSVARQVEIIRTKLNDGMAIDDIMKQCAPPGFSEHHTGRAVDIGSPELTGLEEIFETTPAFAWLSANASRFGFVMSYPRDNADGYVYEPWHWCFRPR